MHPRCVLPGTTYFVTRRCSERRFFLRPSDAVNDIFMYALAKAARDLEVQIHAFVAMSNHIHLVLTDVAGELPTFMQRLDLEISRAVSPEIGRWNGFWEPGRYSAIDLLDEAAIIEKVAYTLANPVRAGLVRHATAWPGATSAGLSFGQTLTVRRPKTKFYARSIQPISHPFTLSAPPVGPDAQQRIAANVRAMENEAELSLRGRNRKVLGTRRVLSQDPFDSPVSWERRRGLNPTYASRDRWLRVEAAQRKRSWYVAYCKARDAYWAGNRDVIFPAGTWAMVKIHRCACEPMAG